MSLVTDLTKKFQTRAGEWIPGAMVERYVLEHTPHTASNARRRLREMVEDGILEQKEQAYKGTNHAWYRYAGKKMRYDYVFDTERNCMVEKLVEA